MQYLLTQEEHDDLEMRQQDMKKLDPTEQSAVCHALEILEVSTMDSFTKSMITELRSAFRYSTIYLKKGIELNPHPLQKAD